MALLGVPLGIVGSFAATRALSNIFFGVTATDPLTFGCVALAFISDAAAASCVPAHLAGAVEPIVARRVELLFFASHHGGNQK